MSLLDKVKKYYDQELKDYSGKYPTLGSLLIEELSNKEYAGEVTISRLLDFANVIGKDCGDAIDELYLISSKDL
jgi:hypothetical protein